MLINMVLYSVRLLNFFPPKDGISDTISPKTILTGNTLDEKRDLPLQFGTYCQVHDNDEPRNSQLPCTKKGAVYLGSTGNVQGGSKFMTL
jgi:hypothetical protein